MIAMRHRSRVLVQWHTIRSKWAGDTLIATSLLNTHATVLAVAVVRRTIPQTALVTSVVRIALAGAAAGREEPEAGRDDRERRRDPDVGEERVSKLDIDLVRIERSLKCADQDGEDDGCC